MGFFDNLIVEEETSTATATATSWGSQGWTKKDDDSDLIIIDDSVSDITTEDVPDTVNSIFSDEKVEETVEFTDEVEIQDEIEPSVELEEVTPEVIPEVIQDTAVIADNSASSEFLSFDNTPKSKENPNEILTDAVSKLETLLKTHADIRNGKMSEIEGINKQIASLKDSAKALTTEVKEIGVEEDKVTKMIELFKSQKV
ncbi:MAG: hypothetical protein ACD_49C00060G0005 [uncultured bacterium (gcode 4)]|uniref:Uncharacterized protein n=1 Tax=uncultured bacterium (gcode 4) TaxID=1234023 RepID=K2BBP2_9BACT|nr:MAG: hypothetical protein ACD_49C00060G0005 [uncultured bacterium (gcode 4)]